MAFRSRWTPSPDIASSWRDGPRPCCIQKSPHRGASAVLDTILLFRDALYGALVIALVCSALGVYVVLRRIVFVGASLAQMSTLGIAISFWLAGVGVAGVITSKPVLLSLLATLLGVVFFSTGMRRARIPADARIGVA